MRTNTLVQNDSNVSQVILSLNLLQMLETSVPTPTSLLTITQKWLHISNYLRKCFGVTGYSFSFLFYALMKEKQETSLLRSTRHATDPADRQMLLNSLHLSAS